MAERRFGRGFTAQALNLLPLISQSIRSQALWLTPRVVGWGLGSRVVEREAGGKSWDQFGVVFKGPCGHSD